VKEIGAVILSQAAALAEQLSAAWVLAYWEQIGSLETIKEAAEKVNLVLIIRGEKKRAQAEKFSSQVVVVPKANLTRNAQITLGVLSASAQALFKPNEILVCLAGPYGLGEVDMIQVVQVSESGSAICFTCQGQFKESIPPHVFNGVLNLAVELAQEGREGRPIGTIFVLGDHEKVLQFSRQAVLNPFAGYPEESLSILGQEMKETIREYSSLDGAFIIRSDGILLAAGRHIQAVSGDLELPQGMGARHHAAAGITAVTQAVAMAISESSGTVTVFFNGQIIASLEKASPGLASESED